MVEDAVPFQPEDEKPPPLPWVQELRGKKVSIKTAITLQNAFDWIVGEFIRVDAIGHRNYVVVKVIDWNTSATIYTNVNMDYIVTITEAEK